MKPALPVVPHVRLGLAWAAALVVTAVLSTWTLAVLLAATAALAGSEVARARGPKQLHPLATAAAPGVIVLAAAAGLAVAVLVAVATAVALLVVPLGGARRVPMVGVAWLLAGAAVSPVVVRGTWGALAAVVLLGGVCAYDAASFLVGTGADSSWEGPAAGVVALVPLTVLTAALLVPPFRGASPWVLGLALAALAPAGTVVARTVVGTTDRRAPALGRLDALLVAGPVWVLLASLLHVG